MKITRTARIVGLLIVFAAIYQQRATAALQVDSAPNPPLLEERLSRIKSVLDSVQADINHKEVDSDLLAQFDDFDDFDDSSGFDDFADFADSWIDD